jgi:hypothetical protein
LIASSVVVFLERLDGVGSYPSMVKISIYLGYFSLELISRCFRLLWFTHFHRDVPRNIDSKK